MIYHYFNNQLMEVEQAQETLKHNTFMKRYTPSEFYIEMYELEIKKKTIEEVSKNVLQYLKMGIP